MAFESFWFNKIDRLIVKLKIIPADLHSVATLPCEI